MSRTRECVDVECVHNRTSGISAQLTPSPDVVELTCLTGSDGNKVPINDREPLADQNSECMATLNTQSNAAASHPVLRLGHHP
jgi:hypothetical protein